jgi:hypothetical protein
MTAQSTAGWLKTVSVLTALSALPLAFSGLPGLSPVANLFTDLAFWPLDGRPLIAAPETRLYAAISGGLTIGLAAMVWMVADRVLARDPAAARAVILTGLSAWCAIDSLGSIAAGAHMNVLINLLIWSAFVWPLRAAAAKAA